jgi:glycosyltransferase involved in cell wall biosynthesis
VLLVDDLNFSKGIKFTERALQCEHPITKKILKIVSEMDYDLFVHPDFAFDSSSPIFTIILTMHDANISYIQESFKSVFEQTYKNTEVILINHGAKGPVEELIWQAFVANKNSKLIKLPKNLYNPSAAPLHDPIINLWNAGLFCSVGDYVYFMAYDDFVSPNYTEKMTKLFIENEKCCTAAPLIVSVNESSAINEAGSFYYKKRNNRDRFTDGVELAQSYMRNKDKIIFAGGVLSVKSNLVLSCGCFDALCDYSQLFKFAINGSSGFDSDAKLYWRSHSMQTNKIQTQMGLVYYKMYKSFLEIYDIKRFHEKVVDIDFANEFQDYFSRLLMDIPLVAFRGSYAGTGIISGLSALMRIFKECPTKICVIATYYFFRDFPAVIYARYLPPSARQRYQKVKALFCEVRT